MVLDAAMVPIVAGLLVELADPGRWATYEDYASAHNAIADMVASMAQDCIGQLAASVDRLYMLLDGVYNGRIYTDVGGLPPVLPVVPPAPGADGVGGLRKQLLDAQGMTPGGWFGIGARPATTADVLAAMRQGSDEDIELLDGIVGALDAADDASDIFNTIRGLITSAGSITLEGATLATLVAASMANAAMMGLQGAQLDELSGLLAEISGKLSATAPANDAATVRGELQQVRELLSPEPYSPIGDDL